MALALAQARSGPRARRRPGGGGGPGRRARRSPPHNERELSGVTPPAHAEVLALARRGRGLGGWRLSAVTLVVTLEPCPMCAGALVAARVGRLVFGAADPKAGACGTLYNLCGDPRLNHELPVTAGVRAVECARF